MLNKIRKSPFFGILTDEVTDISNVQNLATFIKYNDHEKGEAHTALIDSTDVLNFSETYSAGSQPIHDCLIELPNFVRVTKFKSIFIRWSICDDGFQCRCRCKTERTPELETFVECSLYGIVWHCLALACADSSNQLNFLKEF